MIFFLLFYRWDQFSSVQSVSQDRLVANPWTVARQSSLSISKSQSLLKLMSINLLMAFNHLILCHPFLLLPSIVPRVFSNESVLPIRWPKYWSFSFSICPSNKYSGLISFRMDWFDLHAVQGTLKSLIQQHSSKASIPTDYTLHGILQARILEWVAVPFPRGSSQPMDQTQVFHTACGFFTS